MDKDLHNIEDLFKKGLEENEEPPSEKIWDIIDKRLDKETVVSIRKKYMRLQQAAILLLILTLATGLSVYLFTNANEKKIIAGQNKNILNESIKENKNSASSKLATSNLNDSDNLKKQSYLNSISQKDNSLSDRNMSNEKNIKKEGSITNADNNKGPARNQYSKGLDKSSVSLNIKPHNTFNTKKRFKPEIQNSILEKNKLQSITTFVESDPSQKLPIVQTNLVVDKINNEHTDLMKPILARINKNVVSNNLKIKPSKQSNFFLTAFYSPNIVFYHFQNSQSQNSNNGNFENDENNISSSTVGALIDYSIYKHWSLQSGLTLGSTNIDLGAETIYAQPDNSGNIKYQINTSSGYGYILPSFNNNPAVGDSILSVSTTHTLRYLGIPLAVKYNINKGKFSINGRAGLVANFLTKGSISTNLEKGNDNEIETTDKIHGLKPFYFTGITGVGLDYNIYKNWSVSFSPTFRFSISSINKDMPVKSFPNSFGGSFGLKMRL